MSSDYIQRLRGELLRAAAAQEARPRRPWERGDARAAGRRRRPARTVRRLRPLAGLVAVALIIAAVVFTLPRDRADDTPVPPATIGQLDYRTTPAAADATADSARTARRGNVTATVSTAGGRITVAAPQAAKADVTALMAPGRLAMYYWEGSVLGPDGRPAPGDTEVTGGPDAGRAAALTKAEAEARAQQVDGARVVRSETGRRVLRARRCRPGDQRALAKPRWRRTCRRANRSSPSTSPSRANGRSRTSRARSRRAGPTTPSAATRS